MRTLLMNCTIVAVLLGITGCKSSRSTVFFRDEMNSEWETEKANGIPITVKVPTHLKLYVYEKHFLENATVGSVNTVRYLELPVVLRDFAHDFVYTEKMVLVDFKRPAAGAFNLEVDFTEDQYIQKVQHDITDETIQRVTEFVDTLAPQGLFRQASDGPGADVERKIKEVKAVVAVGMFEVDAPDFEAQVAEFLNCHINKAHDAWVVPPGHTGFRRDPLDPATVAPSPDLCPDGECYQ